MKKIYYITIKDFLTLVHNMIKNVIQRIWNALFVTALSTKYGISENNSVTKFLQTTVFL